MRGAPRISGRWKLFLLVAFVAGVILRLIHVEDMEWKEDEYYNYYYSQLIGVLKPWPALGMPSGVYLPNPGMSIWVFVWLARIAHATDPLELARALQIFSVLGVWLLLPFALDFAGPSPRDRAPWLWAFAIAMVNPFAVFYQRKLWPEPFLPFFSMLTLMGWWRRETRTGALVWGLVGAALGQIHMSGFFYSASLFLFTVAFDGKARQPRRTRWGYWVAGSVVGAIPLIPWFRYLLEHPRPPGMTTGWSEITQLKFWQFWITDPLGLVLTNPLGLHRGDSIWAQLSDFVRYPIVAGHATYLCGAAHLLVAFSALWVLCRRPRFFRPLESLTQSRLATASALFGFGILMTATGVNIRRYYMMVSFPFEFVWLAGLALSDWESRRARFALPALWLGQLMISACFVAYVHANNGAPDGDYGEAYHVQQERHLHDSQESWPDLKLYRDP